MKKISIILMFLLCLPILSPVHASEKIPYFGVGAEVKKVEDNVYVVKTEGSKENEGFVFSPVGIKGGEIIIFQVELKGNATIYLNVDETDARGTFLAETVSPVISLHDAWRTIQLEVELQESTTEIDAMVLTNQKEKTEFMFRNVTIRKKDQPSISY
ncbi:hypothetical protein ACLM5H_20660 [Fredinandcohnia humi]